MAIRQELELDLSAAETGVDRLDALLTQAAQQFQMALAEAIGVIADVETTIDVSADTEGVPEEVDQAVDSAEGLVDVDADADDVTGEIDQAVDNADGLVDVDADTADVAGEIDRAVDDADGVVHIEAEVEGISGQVDQAIGNADSEISFDAEASGIESTLSDVEDWSDETTEYSTGALTAGFAQAGAGILTSIKGWTGAGAALIAGLGIVTLARQVGEVTAAAQGTEPVLKSMYEAAGHGSDEATRAMELLNDEFGSSQIAMTAFLGGAENLAYLGLTAQETVDIMGFLEDVIIGTGGSAESLDTVTEALQEMSNRGKASMQDLQRISSASVPILDMLADRLGVDIPEAMEMVSAGGVDVNDVLGAMQDQGGTWAGALVDAADNVGGTFSATWDRIKNTLVSGLGIAFLPALDAVTPALESFGETIESLTTGLADSGTIDAFGNAIAELAPALIDVIDLAASVIVAFTPWIGTALTIVEPFARGLSTVSDFLDMLGWLIEPLMHVVTGIYLVRTAMNALSAHPLILLGVAVVSIIGMIQGMGDSMDEASVSNEELREQLFGTAQDAEGTAAALHDLVAEADDWITTSSEFSSRNVVGALADIGIESEEVAELLQQGADGFQEFIAQAIAAGEISLEIDGIEQSATRVRHLDDNLSHLLASGDAKVTQGRDIAMAFNKEQTAMEGAAEAQIDMLRSSGELSEEQLTYATAVAESESATAGHVEVLNKVNDVLAHVPTTTEDATDAISDSADTFVSLAQAVIDGTVSMEDHIEVAERLGISTDEAREFIESMQEQIDAWVESATQKIPTVSDALQGIGESADPQKLLENLREQEEIISGFQGEIQSLIEAGHLDLAQFLIDEGPVVGGAYARALADGQPDLQAELDEQLGKTRQSGADTEAYLRNEAAPALVGKDGAVVSMAREATSAWDRNIDFSQATGEEIDSIVTMMEAREVVDRARELGIEIGDSTIDGLQAAITDREWEIVAQAGAMAQWFKDTVSFMFESDSPSKVFRRIGHDVWDGFLLGNEDRESDVVMEAERIARGAINATEMAVTASVRPTTLVTEPVPNTAPPIVPSTTTRTNYYTINGMNRDPQAVFDEAEMRRLMDEGSL